MSQNNKNTKQTKQKKPGEQKWMNGREWEKQKGSRCGQQHRRRRRSRLFVGCYYAREKGQPTNWWTCFSICCFCCCIHICLRVQKTKKKKKKKKKDVHRFGNIRLYILLHYPMMCWLVGWWFFLSLVRWMFRYKFHFRDNWTGVKKKSTPVFFRGFKMMNLSIIIRFRFQMIMLLACRRNHFCFRLFCFVFSSILNGRIGKELGEKKWNNKNKIWMIDLKEFYEKKRIFFDSVRLIERDVRLDNFSFNCRQTIDCHRDTLKQTFEFIFGMFEMNPKFFFCQFFLQYNLLIWWFQINKTKKCIKQPTYRINLKK